MENSEKCKTLFRKLKISDERDTFFSLKEEISHFLLIAIVLLVIIISILCIVLPSAWGFWLISYILFAFIFLHFFFLFFLILIIFIFVSENTNYYNINETNKKNKKAIPLGFSLGMFIVCETILQLAIQPLSHAGKLSGIRMSFEMFGSGVFAFIVGLLFAYSYDYLFIVIIIAFTTCFVPLFLIYGASCWRKSQLQT